MALEPLPVTATWGGGGGSWSVLAHGGAGDVPASSEAAHLEGCRAAAAAAQRILAGGGWALDAVQAAVRVLEDDPHFNAGTGGSLNREGELELDASLMEGTDLRAGSVCSLPPFKNPILVARAVFDEGLHVLYAGAGAARFATEHGFMPSPQEAMITPAARERWQRVKAGAVSSNWAGGTVGAVARDVRGAVAAATSTGGKMLKAVGRVGDSPILGAGTYADDGGGACSNTGDGEAVMRLCLAKCAIDWMRAGRSAEEAAREAIHLLGSRTQAAGGIILVDLQGRLGWARNTRTMSWGAAAAEWPDVRGGV